MTERHIEIGGAVTFWSLSEWTARDRLLDGLAALGLERFVPEPRPLAAALREALEQVLGGPRVLVRPLSRRDGFAVVREERGEASNAYEQQLVARVAPDNGATVPSIRFAPDDERARQVRDVCLQQLGLVHAAQVSTALVSLVEHLGGTRLRPGGAVYWIPGYTVDAFQRAARAVEAAAEGRPGAVYLLRHRMDADAVRAVRDAVVAEVQVEARRIRDEVQSGELGERALENRRGQAGELRRKVLLYEQVLETGLTALHEVVDEADQTAAAATLLAGAAGTGDPSFTH
jgi:hypothetical protein